MRAIDALDRAAFQTPEAVFVQQGTTAITYAQAAALTHRIAARAQALGAAPGTRVAFLSPNDWRGLVFMYGLWRAGLVLVPVNVRNSAAMNAAILRQHRPVVMVHHSDVAALAARSRLSCLLCSPGAAWIAQTARCHPCMSGWHLKERWRWTYRVTRPRRGRCTQPVGPPAPPRV